MNGTTTTPAVTNPYLAWSPVNSQSRVVDLVRSAKHTLIVSSENLSDPVIQAALIDAASRQSTSGSSRRCVTRTPTRSTTCRSR
jgi:hypothetical protein